MAKTRNAHPPSGPLSSSGLLAHPRWVRILVGLSVRAPYRMALELTAAALLAGWVLTALLGRVGAVSLAWFSAVIVLTGIRFRWRGALVTAIAAGALVGPLLPSHSASGLARTPWEMVLLTAYFVGIGLFVVFMTTLSAISLEDQVADLRSQRDLLRGLHRDEFRVEYQPIVVLATEEVIGAECLLRWDHPERGRLQPDEFLPVVEHATIMNALSEFVLDTACRDLAAFNRRFHPAGLPFVLGVNISATQLNGSEVADQLRAVFAETGVDPKQLVIEITETALIENLDAVVSPLEEIRALGIPIVIDDFGTGYSSLSYLHRLPVSGVKIDREFVADIGRPGREGSLVPLVIELAHSHELAVLAEGVETEFQARALLGAGCRYAQGFHFHKPQTSEQLGELLGRQDRPRAPAEQHRS